MVKHVVCFKLKDSKDKESVKEILLSMKGKVPMLKDMEVGVDFLGSPRSFDVYLSVLLEDRAALDAYQKDAYHAGVVKEFIVARAEKMVAVDFEV